MKKKFLLFGALVGALLLSSCSGGSKKQTVSSESTEELDDASKVINYYHMSLAVLRHVANAKDINAVLGYMEQTGKVPEVDPIAPPEIAARDTAELLDPGDYFNPEVRQNLKQNYAGLFNVRTQFYDNFNKFLAYKKSKDTAKTAQLLDENYKLSVELSEYKQVIFDILSPLTEQAESELLADEPLKDQIMAMRKMSGTVQSIMNLYSRKHAMDGVRIDLKMAELEKELKRMNIDMLGDINPNPDRLKKKPVANVKPDVKVDAKPDEKKPVIVVKKPASKEPEYAEGELIPNLFVRYVGKKDYGDKTILSLKVINRLGDDYNMNLIRYDVKVVNEKGEEVKIERMRLGSSEDSHRVSATIVPDVEISLVLEMKKIQSAKLIQISDSKGTVKLRNLK